MNFLKLGPGISYPYRTNKINNSMKIHDIISETMTAGSVATVVKPLSSDVQRVVQRPKKPKKTKWAHKKPGPKSKKESTIIKR